MNMLAIRQRYRRFPAFILLAGLLGACATINTGSHFDETANFGAYKSFSWIADEPLISDETSIPVSALSKSKIKSAIRRELEKKGYIYKEDKGDADFVVAYTLGTRDAIRVDSYPVHYRGQWGWHVPYSYYYYRDISAHTYTTGTLAVDVFDNDSGKPVWHGWAEKVVTESDRKDPGTVIDAGVSKLLEAFPR